MRKALPEGDLMCMRLRLLLAHLILNCLSLVIALGDTWLPLWFCDPSHGGQACSRILWTSSSISVNLKGLASDWTWEASALQYSGISRAQRV